MLKPCSVVTLLRLIISLKFQENPYPFWWRAGYPSLPCSMQPGLPHIIKIPEHPLRWKKGRGGKTRDHQLFYKATYWAQKTIEGEDPSKNPNLRIIVSYMKCGSAQYRRKRFFSQPCKLGTKIGGKGGGERSIKQSCLCQPSDKTSVCLVGGKESDQQLRKAQGKAIGVKSVLKVFVVASFPMDGEIGADRHTGICYLVENKQKANGTHYPSGKDASISKWQSLMMSLLGLHGSQPASTALLL